jgi:hypothetical protein
VAAGLGGARKTARMLQVVLARPMLTGPCEIWSTETKGAHVGDQCQALKVYTHVACVNLSAEVGHSIARA